MAERTGPVAVDAALHDLAEVLARYLEATGWTAAEGDVPVFTASLIIAAPELLASLIECRDAVAAAMRVVADLDTAHVLGMDADTRQERFIAEMHISGVRDGFGARADTAIKKARGPA